jgi:hypothetical protein
VLNTPVERRQKKLDEDLEKFPYVNGDLFSERLPIPSFDAVMREYPLEVGNDEAGNPCLVLFAGAQALARLHNVERVGRPFCKSLAGNVRTRLMGSSCPQSEHRRRGPFANAG